MSYAPENGSAGKAAPAYAPGNGSAEKAESAYAPKTECRHGNVYATETRGHICLDCGKMLRKSGPFRTLDEAGACGWRAYWTTRIILRDLGAERQDAKEGAQRCAVH